MKSLNDWEHEMSRLYDEVRGGETELKTAAELTNIAGKALKAQQLKLAREIFENGRAGAGLLGAIQQSEVKLVKAS